jgi:hypothetical protein
MPENASMKIWNALEPLIKREIERQTRSCQRMKSMTVSTAYNGSSGLVGVKEAFGSEIFLPVMSTMDKSRLVVGASVWVCMPYSSMSNAIVMMMGDGNNGSAGGGTSEPEVYVGSTEPTGTEEIWIDTSEDAGGGDMLGILARTYPIGSVYLSVNGTDPGALFGGTWERLKDRFLLAAGDTYAAGATGGEAAHTLTVEEMPSHSHEIQYISAETGTAVAGVKGAPSANWWSADYIRATGGGAAHNNMPPYIAVYVWKRTA